MKGDFAMGERKFALTLTEEQANAVRQACEFFMRVRCGQFMEIVYHCLSDKDGEVLSRRDTKQRIAEGLIAELKLNMSDVDGSSELLEQLTQMNYVRPCYSVDDGAPMNYSYRRESAEKLLFLARKYLMPELSGEGHSHGIGFSQIADRAYDVYQVLRYTMADEETRRNVVPFSYEALPECKEVVE